MQALPENLVPDRELSGQEEPHMFYLVPMDLNARDQTPEHTNIHRQCCSAAVFLLLVWFEQLNVATGCRQCRQQRGAELSDSTSSMSVPGLVWSGPVSHDSETAAAKVSRRCSVIKAERLRGGWGGFSHHHNPGHCGARAALAS